MIEPTPQAINQLRDLLAARQSPPDHGLRLSVEKGGCAGLQYAVSITSPAEDDITVERDGVRFYLAADSLSYLRGLTLDYEDSLHDAGFKMINPNAARSCGCGTSFEPLTTAATSPALTHTATDPLSS